MATSFLPIRSLSTNTSPTRPVSSSGTIRRVTPSPDSDSAFNFSLQQNALAASSPPRRNSSATLARPPGPTPLAARQDSTATAARKPNSDKPPSGSLSARLSKYKDMAQDDSSPTQQRVMRRSIAIAIAHANANSGASPCPKPRRTPRPLSMPLAAPEPRMEDSAYPRPETPSPVTDEQRASQYAPMGAAMDVVNVSVDGECQQLQIDRVLDELERMREAREARESAQQRLDEEAGLDGVEGLRFALMEAQRCEVGPRKMDEGARQEQWERKLARDERLAVRLAGIEAEERRREKEERKRERKERRKEKAGCGVGCVVM